MNGVSTLIGGCIINKSGTKGGHGEANKSNSIIYWCIIYNYIEHKIYDYLHKDVIHVMFTKKATMMLGGLKGLRFRKEDVTINMVLAINTYNQIPENIVVLLKEKNLTKTRRLIGKRRKSFNIHLKKLLKTCNRKNLQGIYLEP